MTKTVAISELKAHCLRLVAEVARGRRELLVQGGRLRLPVQLEAWLDEAMSIPGLETVPLTVPIIAAAARRSGLRDRADMLIVATALRHGAPLPTSDGRFGDSGLVRVIA